jgi:hypothetical protein
MSNHVSCIQSQVNAFNDLGEVVLQTFIVRKIFKNLLCTALLN